MALKIPSLRSCHLVSIELGEWVMCILRALRFDLIFPSRLRCLRLWLRTIASKSTCGGPWLSPGKPTRRAVTTMGFNDLVVGEVHMLGPSCQRYNWHTGRCGSIAFGSSPRRGKTLISNPRCLAEVSTRGYQEITSRKNQKWSP